MLPSKTTVAHDVKPQTEHTQKPRSKRTAVGVLDAVDLHPRVEDAEAAPVGVAVWHQVVDVEAHAARHGAGRAGAAAAPAGAARARRAAALLLAWFGCETVGEQARSTADTQAQDCTALHLCTALAPTRRT
jgi:hypothetical protein